jgi:hypothetical protein
MEQKLTKIFQRAKYEPVPNLSISIWRVITKKERKMARLKLWAFILAGVVSLGGLVPALALLTRDFVQSGFYEYFSLIFSDSGSIFSYWKELVFSLAESLPTMSIILSLTLIFIFLLSLKYAMKQIIKNQLSLSF